MEVKTKKGEGYVEQLKDVTYSDLNDIVKIAKEKACIMDTVTFNKFCCDSGNGSLKINLNVIQDPDALPKPFVASKRKLNEEEEKVDEEEEVIENFNSKIEISESFLRHEIPQRIKSKHAVLRGRAKKRIARPVKYKASGVKTTFLLGMILIFNL